MRQIASIEDERQAQRLVAFLITQGISATGELEETEWAIWVMDEDQIDQAKHLYADFLKNPDDAKYSNVESEANAIRNEERKKREEAQKNYIRVRHTMGPMGTARRAPVTIGLIAACVILTIVTSFNNDQARSDIFMTLSRQSVTPNLILTNPAHALSDVFSGQVWRLFTPMFIHGDAFHLLFNMLWAYILGSQIENRKGWLFLIALALASQAAAIFVEILWTGPFAIGFSGVNFGFFGYIWLKMIFDPRDGLYASRLVIILMMLNLFLGFSGWGNVANGAHLGGLALGCVWGYVASVTRKR